MQRVEFEWDEQTALDRRRGALGPVNRTANSVRGDGSGGRRDVLLALLAASLGALGGCGGAGRARAAASPGPLGAPSAPRPGPAPGPAEVAALTDLLSPAGLRWLVLAEPESIARIEWLKAPVARVLQGERLDLVAQTSGLDLRELPEIAVGGYAEAGRAAPAPTPAGPAAPEPEGDVVFYLARHRRSAVYVERLFRERLTGDEQREVERDDAVVVSGSVGSRRLSFVRVGETVVGYQYGGDALRGPARIAALFAAGRLTRAAPLSRDAELGRMRACLGPAAVTAFLPGPFEEAMAAGARGLLGAASALGAALAVTERQSLRLELALAGDYSSDAPRAVTLLDAAWQDLAKSDLGHLCGLAEPTQAHRAWAEAGALRLRVELDPARLFDGLAAATMDDVRTIMR
ncbi:MAG: hypothetical protein HY744_08475 [Deltaproteobacteria bacterium]|nr:hypothetical protein [Deltaproteobacteria bacterium]